MGMSLAMVGAATLAHALDEADGNPAAALARYDAVMRPVVDEAHGMAEDGAAILFPATREAIEERNAQLAAVRSA
jgi:2-polyprenyl-6-methoxyphenol hydroxylase-like FAD-dependent oxidoreductase